MKSQKPNDPRRLNIKSIDKMKETSPDQLTLTVKVEYETWCCTEGHEYANATKAVTDLFERTADLKERITDYASRLEAAVDILIANKPLSEEDQNMLANQLNDMARRMRGTYSDDD
jgi:hypothetical protein